MFYLVENFIVEHGETMSGNSVRIFHLSRLFSIFHLKTCGSFRYFNNIIYFMTKDSVVHVTCNAIMNPRTFFVGGGGRDIERNQWPGSSDIDGQDQCEHMLSLVMVIAIF